MIYLDHHSTTPLDPQVFEAMKPYFVEHFGNPSSSNHPYGWAASKAVETARAQVAEVFAAQPKEVVFTSGASESIALALRGTFEFYLDEPVHFISSEVEHKAVLETLEALKLRGAQVTLLKPDNYGRITCEQVIAAIKPETRLVSLLYGNNEVGTLNPISEIGAALKDRKILFHVDAAQCTGRVSCDAQKIHADLISVSSHKVYGPKGVGALYVRAKDPRVRLTPQILGGGQERGMRSGTLNVPGIVGMGAACELALSRMKTESDRLAHLRDRFIQTMTAELPGVTLNGHPLERLPHNVSLLFSRWEPDSLMKDALAIAAVSAGSACATSQMQASHVLTAIGLTEDQAQRTLRFGLGASTRWEDLEQVYRHFRQLWVKRT